MAQQFLFYGHIYKRIEIITPMRYLYMCIKAQLTRVKRLKPPKGPPTDEAINKMSYIQEMEYYLH